MEYLHDSVKVLHNDIKPDNMLIASLQMEDLSLPDSFHSILPSTSYNRFLSGQHIVIVDFGKGTTASAAKRYTLTEEEREPYLRRYSHVAPQIVHGESSSSNMFSVGRIFQSLLDHSCFAGLPEKDLQTLISLTDRLTSTFWHSRPSAKECLKVMDTMFL